MSTIKDSPIINWSHARRVAAICVLAGPALAPGARAGGPSWRELGYRLDPRCAFLMQGRAAGSFVELDDGRLMALSSDDNGTVELSADDGKTWERIATMYEGEGPGRLTQDYECQIALKTRTGAIVWIYRDFENRHWAWDDQTGEAVDPKLTVWSIRSLDEGKTWVDRQMIAGGYCGSLNDIIQTSTGEIVVPIQQYVPNPGRHCQHTWMSADDGKTWRKSNRIDIGGHGHHDGVFEGTLAELKDGRLMMLMRTPLDRFWLGYSFDGGRSWKQIQPTGIAASTAPGFLLRLASGRLALVWNPLPPDGTMRPLAELRAGDKPHGQGSELPAQSWRNSLQIALSGDEGQTWSQPATVALGPRLCYPQMWERSPGELWVSFVAGPKWVRNLIRVREEDLLKTLPEPTGRPLTIVALGSSTTAPRGSLVVYPMLLQWELAAEGRNVKIINAGVGSDNTVRAAARLADDVLSHNPDLVIIQLGINDSAIDVWKGATKPRVPIDEYQRNLEQFVTAIRAQGGKVILMTPNPLRWTEKLKPLYGKPPYDPNDPDGFSFLLKDYAKRMQEVAARNDVPLVDSFRLFSEYGRADGQSVDDLLLDGMHPNDRGHGIEADALLERIRALFPAGG
jgi:lysophospholipase L1-like esterase